MFGILSIPLFIYHPRLELSACDPTVFPILAKLLDRPLPVSLFLEALYLLILARFYDVTLKE